LATGRLKAAALASVPVAQLAIDLVGNLGVANATAEALFNLRPRDVGRPFQDLEVSFRPVELRSHIEQARTDMRQIELRDVEWQRVGSQPRHYDVTIAPLFGTPGDLVGVGISFIDVTRDRRMRDDLEHAHAELERAHEELQSLNEELETTNEELQSTNEELETMNEELQSTNDELQEINEELRQRTEEVNQTNDFLGSVFRSLGNAVIVLTEELYVKVWSPGAEEMWGLRADETVGESLLALDIGLPTEVVTPHLRTLLSQAGDGWPALELTAVNRRGKTVNLRIAATPLRSEEGATGGFILVIDHIPAEAPQPEQEIPG
jgi:two-component system CheB/CheR fusion protein